MLAGTKAITGLGDQAFVIRIDKDGGVVWQNDFGGTVDEWLTTRPVILNDGSILVAGQKMSGTIPFGLLIKISASGSQEWMRTYYKNPVIDNYVFDFIQTSDKGFLLTGTTYLTSQDAWAVKVDSLGCEVANCSVGIKELNTETSELKVFPNPANEFITISLPEQDLADFVICITNVLGELQQTETGNATLSVSHLATGIYYISAENKKTGERLRTKFIKVK